jgi:hypothetical protein
MGFMSPGGTYMAFLEMPHSLCHCPGQKLPMILNYSKFPVLELKGCPIGAWPSGSLTVSAHLFTQTGLLTVPRIQIPFPFCFRWIPFLLWVQITVQTWLGYLFSPAQSPGSLPLLKWWTYYYHSLGKNHALPQWWDLLSYYSIFGSR